jgi:hypothetical protein
MDILGSIEVAGTVDQHKKLNYWGGAPGNASMLSATAGVVGTGTGVYNEFLADTGKSACLAAGLLTAAAGVRMSGWIVTNSHKSEECGKLSQFISSHPLPTYVPGGGPDGTDNTSTNRMTPLAGNNSAPNATGGGNSGKFAASASTLKALENFGSSPQFAQATAGDVFAPLLKSISSNPQNIPNDLQRAAGIGLSELASRLGSGQSLSQIAAGTAGGEALASKFAQIDKDLKAGNIKFKNGASLIASAGGGYARAGGAPVKAAHANPFGMFGGMKGPSVDGGAVPSETTFEKAKRALASSDASGDIWHEGYGGTIFQIVSHKLDGARDRVEQLEWDTPLNRALTGLPARKVK